MKCIECDGDVLWGTYGASCPVCNKGWTNGQIDWIKRDRRIMNG